MSHSDSVDTLLRGPVDWYTREAREGWANAVDGHVALLMGNDDSGFTVFFRGDTRTLPSLPAGWRLLGVYPPPTSSLSEQSEALAARLLGAIESHPAISVPRQVVAAWDLNPHNSDWLGEYDVGPGGARLGQHRLVPSPNRGQAIDELTRRQVTMGSTWGGSPAVWSLTDPLHGGVWSKTGQKLSGSTTEMTLGFRKVAGRDVTAVDSFVDPDDLGHSGVSLLCGQQEIVVIEQHDPAPRSTPNHRRDDASIDGAWASALGRDLATWLDVFHQDNI
jgi:hypothetical protein